MSEEHVNIVPNDKKQSVEKLVSALKEIQEAGGPNIPLFLGTNKTVHFKILETASVFLSLQEAISEGEEKRAVIAKRKYDELKEEYFPETDDEELTVYLTSYFTFYSRVLDRTLLNEESLRIVKRDDFGNTTKGLEGKRTPLIKPMTPSLTEKMSVRDKMRRSFLSAYDSPDTFTIILMNSVMVFKIKIPTPLELVRLINDIQIKLKNYGEKFNVSSLHLERAGIAKLIVDFIIDRISAHTVKNLVNYEELKTLILYTDLNVLATGLLAACSPKGVNFQMFCLADKCNFNKSVVLDPAGLVIDNDVDYPKKLSDALSSICNEGVKLSREELRELHRHHIYNGEEVDTIIKFKDGRGKLGIRVPYLSDYFNSYDLMGKRINQDIKQLAIDFPNDKLFRKKRKEYLAAIRMGEYLQWFYSYEMSPESGVEADTLYLTRDDDPSEFEEGLIDIFNTDDDLYNESLVKLINVAPYLSYTFVGLPNDTCPSCKKEADPEKKEINKGFTPIDPIMNFFDHTRMNIGLRTEKMNMQEEILS